MHAIPRSAAAAGAAALLLALLGGCATADPLGSRATSAPVANDEPSTPDEPDEPSEPDQPDEPDEPIETNEVRLTWVETGGASTATLVFPFDLPYTALFQVDVDGDSAVVEAIALDTSGEFSVESDGCSGQTVTPDQPCSISLFFDVDGPGTYQATLRVTTDGGSEASIPVVIDVVEDAVEDDSDTDGANDADDTDGTDGTDETDGTDGTDENGTDTETGGTG